MQPTELRGFFSILDYHISHRRMLIRSTETSEEGVQNTDLLFDGIFYIEMPDKLDVVTIREGSEQEYEYVESRCFFEVHRQFSKVFVLRSQGKDYYVGARSFEASENDMPPLESSL